ncbi:MAG: hypothetical protein KatS3mg083_149 [Candidatus Dojkabacteria bacterium]|nr:MAG: hypothetical protein KatS3mg083_149 [Candidatus Dojkabacteria bacterium]
MFIKNILEIYTFIEIYAIIIKIFYLDWGVFVKNVKLYNIILPLWMLMFLPPLIIISLVGNFVIDSLVVIGCFYAFKVAETGLNLKEFYKKHILKVWGFGFLSDFIGAFVIFFS